MSGKRNGRRPAAAASGAGAAAAANGRRWTALAVGLAAVAGVLAYRELAADTEAAAGGRIAGERDPDRAELEALIRRHVAALARDPSAHGHGALGLVYEANEMWDRAAQCFADAARLDPSDPGWHLHLGIVSDERGDVEAARASFERAVEARSDLAAARFRLADALQREGRIDDALAHFRAAAELAPESSEAHAGLGAALFEKGELEEARVSLERACALDPDYRTAHYQLGRVLRALGENDAAARELALGVDGRKRYVPDPLAPRRDSLRVGYSSRVDGAIALVRQGRAAEAVGVLERLLQQRPDDTNVLNNLAAAHMDCGAPARALPLLERARAIDDTAFAVWVNLSSWASRTGKHDEALRHAERAVELAGDVSATHAARGKALLALGRREEAVEALSRAAELDARAAGVQVVLGATLLELRRVEEAEAHLRRAMELAPDGLEAYVLLARMYAGLERFDDARALLAKTRGFAPGHPAVTALEGKIDVAAGR